MKLLFDFLPIVLFFATFRVAEANKVAAAALANQYLGPLFAGAAVGGEEAPVLLATLVVILATLGQVAWLKLRRQHVDTMLWVSLALVVVMGGLTLWLRDEMFIKWKPTLLYWAMSGAFLLGPLLFGKNLLQSLLGSQLTVPPEVWRRVNLAWVVFFAAMGAINLWVAFNFSTETWVSYKLFGGIGLLLAFSFGQALYLARFMPEEPRKPEGEA